MDLLDNIAAHLNQLLYADKVDNQELEKIISTLDKELNTKIRLLNYEFYNEERLNSAIVEKKRQIELSNFELASKQRFLEKKCQHYLDLKTKLGIEKSVFYRVRNALLYFYLGTAKNDIKVRTYLKNFSS